MVKFIYRVFFSILFFSFLHTGCSDKSDMPDYKNPASIYLLSPLSAEEWFSPIKDFSGITGHSALIPWTQAVRITDIAETKNKTIVILINRKGVITASADYLENKIPENSSIESSKKESSANRGKKSTVPVTENLFFSKITDENLTNSTSGKIIVKNNSVLCHVYIDTFFDTNLSAPLSPFVEIDIENKKSVYSQHYYPAIVNKFSLINLKKTEEKWFSAWKKSDTNGTLFKYFIHNGPLGENSNEIAESRFMLANQFLNLSNLPDKLKEFILIIAKNEINNNFVIELELRSKENPVVITYLLGSPGSDSAGYEKMCVSAEQEKYFITYRGEIYLAGNDKLYLFSGVEKLPPSCNYTVLYASENTLYAAWEEQSLFLTGASGFTLIDKKRVDKILQ